MERTSHHRLESGDQIVIRPLTIADRDELRRGLDGLGQHTRWLRFHGERKQFSESDLDYLVAHDGYERIALCASLLNDSGQEIRGLGVARAHRDTVDSKVAEISIVVIDDWQRKGIGTVLLAELADRCIDIGITIWSASFLEANGVAIQMVSAQGIVLERLWSHGVLNLKVQIDHGSA